MIEGRLDHVPVIDKLNYWLQFLLTAVLCLMVFASVQFEFLGSWFHSSDMAPEEAKNRNLRYIFLFRFAVIACVWRPAERRTGQGMSQLLAHPVSWTWSEFILRSMVSFFGIYHYLFPIVMVLSAYIPVFGYYFIGRCLFRHICTWGDSVPIGSLKRSTLV